MCVTIIKRKGELMWLRTGVQISSQRDVSLHQLFAVLAQEAQQRLRQQLKMEGELQCHVSNNATIITST